MKATLSLDEKVLKTNEDVTVTIYMYHITLKHQKDINRVYHIEDEADTFVLGEIEVSANPTNLPPYTWTYTLHKNDADKTDAPAFIKILNPKVSPKELKFKIVSNQNSDYPSETKGLH